MYVYRCICSLPHLNYNGMVPGSRSPSIATLKDYPSCPGVSEPREELAGEETVTETLSLPNATVHSDSRVLPRSLTQYPQC